MDRRKAMGFSEAEVEALSLQADQDIIDGKFDKNKKSGNLVPMSKAILLEKATQGIKWVCAAELMVSLNRKGANLETSRHLGDLLGNGLGGFMLASTTHYNPKKKNQRYYRIPDAVEFRDWFENSNAILPKEYYSEEELRIVLVHLRKREIKGLKQDVHNA